MPGYAEVFGLKPAQQAREWSIKQTAVQVGKSAGANVLHPGEQGKFTFRFTNKTDSPLRLNGTLEVIPYGTSVKPGDIWVPHVFRINTPTTPIPLTVSLPPQGQTEVTITPPIPAKFGGYALIANMNGAGRAFAGTVVRTLPPEPGRVQYPTYALDLPWPHEISEAVTTIFERLGIKGCRMGAGYYPTTRPDFEQHNAQFFQHLKWAEKHNITAMLTVGEGGAPMPLGRPRPWLSPEGVMLDTKTDLAWLPEYDPDFQKWSRQIAGRFGYPKGPVNAIELWNEPWEGISISGWGADLPRFREMYLHMAKGIVEAREKDGVEVLIGGACSSSNTRDKLFCDGTLSFLPYLDFVSIHYQPLSADPALEKMWVNRTGKYGAVRVWDTESWVANSEDRVAGVIASMRAQGQSRTAGIYGGNVFTPEIVSDNPRIGIAQAWSPAAAVAATQHFIGQRPFQKILFPNGLPWVFVFEGRPVKDGSPTLRPDDGTLVILGDLGAIYEQNRSLFRSVQSQLPKGGGLLTLPNGGGQFVLYDFYGNPIPAKGGQITVPLNGLGYFLRTKGTKGSFAKLIQAVRTAKISGYPPVEIIAHDFIAANSPLRITLTNIYNVPVSGKLTGTLAGKTLPTQTISLPPHTTKTVTLAVPLVANPMNTYPLRLTFDAGKGRQSQHTEALRVNTVSRRTVSVDGDLSDWEGVRPQTATANLGVSMTEKAYLPFQNFDEKTTAGVATGYLAADKDYFYFAAKIADTTPYPGNIRFATRDDDQYYYPEKSYAKASTASGNFSVRWTGKVTPPTTGRYRFITVSDDGVRLWVNGKQVIDNWTDHGPTENDAIVDLKAGEPCEVKMEFYQGGGGAEARLHWESPDGKRRPVPGMFNAELFRNRDLSGTPLVTRTDTTIDFAWSGSDVPDPKFGDAPMEELVWNPGVRRFSYRKDPDLPAGNGTDNVQIAFNVLPQAQKSWLPFAPGTMPRFMVYEDTDYEFALNQVADTYGGGTEIWCLQKPGMVRKHFYPRQPSSPADGGAITEGKLVMRRDGNTRIVECAIPWSAMPEVRDAWFAGKSVKFSYRVNDNSGPAFELAAGRSVSKDNPRAFHNDWTTHWANELEFKLGD
jgi:hypothetical protein